MSAVNSGTKGLHEKNYRTSAIWIVRWRKNCSCAVLVNRCVEWDTVWFSLQSLWTVSGWRSLGIRKQEKVHIKHCNLQHKQWATGAAHTLACAWSSSVSRRVFSLSAATVRCQKLSAVLLSFCSISPRRRRSSASSACLTSTCYTSDEFWRPKNTFGRMNFTTVLSVSCVRVLVLIRLPDKGIDLQLPEKMLCKQVAL